MKILFAPFSLIFAGLSFLRWKFFRIGILKSGKAPAPVVSVGNIALGGTGKTPCVIWLAKELKDRDYDPAILTRGYKKKIKGRMIIDSDSSEAALAGDEPAMMAMALGTIPIAADADRLGSAKILGGNDKRIFILDDGFQHLRLKRDFDLVLLRGDDPFGGGHFTPWGTLRDGLWRIPEADAIVIVGNIEKFDKEKIIPTNKPIFFAEKKASNIRTLTGKRLPLDVLKGVKVVAFTGIAHPENFGETSKSLGAELAEIVPFADHHQFKPSDIKGVERIAERHRADILITTEKDAVRLAGIEPRLTTYVVSIELEFDKPEELIGLILKKIGYER